MASEYQTEDFWTGPRRELRAWFHRNAPSLGELYEGALKMLFISNFPGRTRFVAHTVREIRNRLPDVIAGAKTSGMVHYKNRLDVISKDWRRAGFSLDGTIPVSFITKQELPSADIPVPRMLFEKIAILIKDHVDRREKPEEAAIRLFEGIALLKIKNYVTRCVLLSISGLMSPNGSRRGSMTQVPKIMILMQLNCLEILNFLRRPLER